MDLNDILKKIYFIHHDGISLSEKMSEKEYSMIAIHMPQQDNFFLFFYIIKQSENIQEFEIVWKELIKIFPSLKKIENSKLLRVDAADYSKIKLFWL